MKKSFLSLLHFWVVLYAYITGKKYDKHWWKSPEKIAVEVGHFIYILFGAGLTCDVVEGTRTISIENNTNARVCISHMVQCIPSKLCIS